MKVKMIHSTALPFLLVAVAFAQQQNEWRVGVLRDLTGGTNVPTPWLLRVESADNGVIYEGEIKLSLMDVIKDQSMGKNVIFGHRLILGEKLQFQVEPESLSDRLSPGPDATKRLDQFWTKNALLRVRQGTGDFVARLRGIEKDGVPLPVPPYRIGVIRQLTVEPLPGFKGIVYPELSPRGRLVMRIESEGMIYEAACETNVVSSLQTWDTPEPQKLAVGKKFAFRIDGDQISGVDPKGETTSQPTRCRSMIIPFSAMVQRFMMPLSAKRRRALVATTPIEE